MVEVEATFEYIAEQPDELTIKVGDLIKNVIQSEGGWWEGELKGKKGMFPDNFVKVLKDGDKDKKEDVVVRREPKKDVQASKRQSVKDLANRIKDKVHDGPAPVRKKVKKRGKVVFAYEPENEDELRLNVGDMVDILKQEEEGWWEGIVNGKQGMLPSNFVEVVDESEPAISEAAEKTDVGESESNLIKGKKIHGIGLGNIFGDGPIKLRSTTGIKSVDKPTEPVKVERPPQEPFERRPKDASLNLTPSANLSPVMDTNHILSETRVAGSGDGQGKRDKGNHSIITKNRTVVEQNLDLKFIDCDDVRLIDNLDTELGEVDCSHNCNAMDDQITKAFVEMLDNLNGEHTKYSLSKAPLLVDQTSNGARSDTKHSSLSSNCSMDGVEFGDSLHTILNELDSCLDMSYEAHRMSRAPVECVGDTPTSVNMGVWSTPEPDSSLLGLMFDREPDVDECVLDACQITPISKHHKFTSAIDSVFVTKKRYSDAYSPSTPMLPVNSTFTPPSSVKSHSDSATPFSPANSTKLHTALPALRETPRTYFASLNRSGNLSPYIQSIAHKYHIFHTPKSDTNTEDTAPTQGGNSNNNNNNSMDESETQTGNTNNNNGMEESPTIDEVNHGQELEADVVASDECLTTDKQGDIYKMVNSYVYDVLGTSYPPSVYKTESPDIISDISEEGILLCMNQKLDYNPCMFDNDTEGLDDDSVAVCIDENSIRLIDSSSKENLDDFLNERASMMGDFCDEEPGALLCMTGNSPSPVKNKHGICTYTQSTPLKDYPDKGIREAYHIVSSQNRSHNTSLPVRLSGKVGESPAGYKSILKDHSRPWPYLPQSGLVRQTSSYCRISFSNDTPSFWFKKDFNESPCKTSSPVCKARSPKRTISDLREKVPSLLELAERVYLDDFKGKVEAFKAENPHLVSLKENRSPYKSSLMDNDRSPAKKKRRKTLSDSKLEPLKKVALNFNQNAVQKPVHREITYDPYDETGTIETFFGDKIDLPYYPGFQPASMILKQQMKKQTVTVENTKLKKDDGDVNKNDSHQVEDGDVNQNNSSLDNALDETPLIDEIFTGNRSRADYLLAIGTSEDSVRFAKDCSEKRRRRIFGTKSKSKESCPVKLVSFKKFGESNEVRQVSRSPIGDTCLRSKASNKPHKPATKENGDSSLSNIEKQELNHVREKFLRKPKLCVDSSEDITVETFFDHGDFDTNQLSMSEQDRVNSNGLIKQCIDKDVQDDKAQSGLVNDSCIDELILKALTYDMQETRNSDCLEPKDNSCDNVDEVFDVNGTAEELEAFGHDESSDGEERIMNRSFASLKVAYQKHKQLSDSFSNGDGRLGDMIEARHQLYGAISDTVFICSDILSRSKLQELDDPPVDNHSKVDSVKEESDDGKDELVNDSSNTTPDPDALLRDLQDIDLSGTPQYAEEDGPDKVALKRALESFDNLFEDNSFTSLGDSPVKEAKRMSSVGIQTECLEDPESPVWTETKDAASMTVFGTKCHLYQPEDSFNEDSESDWKNDISLKNDFTDDTVEVLDDSILNIVGKPYTMYDNFVKCHAESANTSTMTEEGNGSIGYPTIEPFMLKVKHLSSPCHYDEAVEIDGSEEEEGHYHSDESDKDPDQVEDNASLIDLLTQPPCNIDDFVDNADNFNQHVTQSFYRESCSDVLNKETDVTKSTVTESQEDVAELQTKTEIMDYLNIDPSIPQSPSTSDQDKLVHSLQEMVLDLNEPLYYSSPVVTDYEEKQPTVLDFPDIGSTRDDPLSDYPDVGQTTDIAVTEFPDIGNSKEDPLPDYQDLPLSDFPDVGQTTDIAVTEFPDVGNSKEDPLPDYQDLPLSDFPDMGQTTDDPLPDFPDIGNDIDHPLPDFPDIVDLTQDSTSDNGMSYSDMVNSSNKENIEPAVDVSTVDRLQDINDDSVNGGMFTNVDLDESDEDPYPV